MNISRMHKLKLLVNDLVANPAYFPLYVKHTLVDRFLLGRTALDLAIPWFPYKAIDFLNSFLDKEMKVFEYGSGGSTLFFASRCKSVLSIEDDETWFKHVHEKLIEKNISNVESHLHPFDFLHPVGFEKSEYLNSIGNQLFDVIVIDGQDWTFNERPACFRRAEKNVVAGGIIVIDDSWRYISLRNSNHARTFRVFQSVGCCRLGVTSTDIYFY